jgi:acetyl esterase/lipase
LYYSRFSKAVIYCLLSTVLISLVGCSAKKNQEALQAKYPAFRHPAKMVFMAGPEESPVTFKQTSINDGVAHILYSQEQNNKGNSHIVVVLGGSEGGFITHHSKIGEAILANGYSMASIAYHGSQGTPPKLKEVAIEPIIRRIKSLSTAENGEKRCVAVVGSSKGAELALLIAANANIADTFVAVAPSNVIWQASEVSLLSRSSWTYNGNPLPFVKYPWFSKGTLTFLTEGVTKARGIHEAGLRRFDSKEQAQIPVEKISVPVLLQTAKQDNLWPSHEMSLAILERLKAKNTNHEFTLTSYELDHYLLSNQQPVDDAVDFITHTLDSNPNCNSSNSQ